MKFTLIFASLLVSVSARPFRRDVDSSLIPEFGATAGVNPDGMFFFCFCRLYLFYDPFGDRV